VSDALPRSDDPPLNPASDNTLLSSLGHLVRGLSAVFWGLPVALVICVQTAKSDWLQPAVVIKNAYVATLFGAFPPIVALALIHFGLTQIGYFQKQERVWQNALDRAKIFSLINLGLSPFLYWWNRMSANPFFTAMIELMVVTSLLYLFFLNLMLRRLAAMLPDEILRIETRLFTKMNNYMLVATGLIFGGFFILRRFQNFPRFIYYLLTLLDQGALWIIMFMILLPIAITMFLTWKIKELILASIFNAERPLG